MRSGLGSAVRPLPAASLLALAPLFWSAPARASEPPESPERGGALEVKVGARGLFGSLIEEGQARLGGGGIAWGSLGFGRGRELELSLGAVKGDGLPALGVAELLARYVLETDSSVQPHLGIGPVLSLDFGRRDELSAGLVVGPGLTWLATGEASRWGVTADVQYRLLGGDGLEHVLTCGVGLAYRVRS